MAPTAVRNAGRYIPHPVKRIDQLETIRLNEKLPRQILQPPLDAPKKLETLDVNARLMSEMRKRLLQMQNVRESEKQVKAEDRRSKGFAPRNPVGSVTRNQGLSNYSSLTGMAAISLSTESDYSSGVGTSGSEGSPRFRERLWRELLY